MKKTKKTSFNYRALLFLTLALLFVSTLTYAKTIVPPGGLTTIGMLANNLEKFFLWIVVPLLVAVIIGVGIIFLTSFGIPERIALGKNILTYAGIGVLIVLFGVGIGEWLGQEQIPYVEAFVPLPEAEFTLYQRSIQALESKSTELKNIAKNFQDKGQTEWAKIFNEDADSLSNMARPLKAVLSEKLLENSEKETQEAYQKYVKFAEDIKSGKSKDKNLLTQYYNEYSLALEKNKMYRGYLTNLSATMYAFGSPETANPKNITDNPQLWDGKSALTPGIAVKISGGELVWQGSYWLPKSNEDLEKIQKAAKAKKATIELAGGLTQDYELGQHVWQNAAPDKKETPVDLRINRVLLACSGGSCSGNNSGSGTAPLSPYVDTSSSAYDSGATGVQLLRQVTYNYYFITPHSQAYDFNNWGTAFPQADYGNTAQFDSQFDGRRAVITNTLSDQVYYYQSQSDGLSYPPTPIGWQGYDPYKVDPCAFLSGLDSIDASHSNPALYGPKGLAWAGTDQDEYNTTGWPRNDIDKWNINNTYSQLEADRNAWIQEQVTAGNLIYDKNDPSHWYMKTMVPKDVLVDQYGNEVDESFEGHKALVTKWKEVFEDVNGNQIDTNQASQIAGGDLPGTKKDYNLANDYLNKDFNPKDLSLESLIADAIKLEEEGKKQSDAIIAASKQCKCSGCDCCPGGKNNGEKCSCCVGCCTQCTQGPSPEALCPCDYTGLTGKLKEAAQLAFNNAQDLKKMTKEAKDCISNPANTLMDYHTWANKQQQQGVSSFKYELDNSVSQFYCCPL